jgi:tyrosinase
MRSDPLFYVHHVQLDRIWWLWQTKDPAKRLTDYAGRRFLYDETDNAVLDDVLSYLGLAENVTVGDVMCTRTRRLCYRY